MTTKAQKKTERAESHMIIKLRNMQIKSAEKARKLAQALDIIEIELGIESVILEFSVEHTFICPEINWDEVGNTPMEKRIREILTAK